MAHDIGQGTYVKFGTVLGTQTVGVYKVNSLSLGTIERDVVDASHLLTTGGREYIASEFYEPGELSLEIHHDPAIQPWKVLTNVSTNQTVSIYFANGGTNTLVWSSYGYAQSFQASVPKDDMMTGTLTIKLSGSLHTTT